MLSHKLKNKKDILSFFSHHMAYSILKCILFKKLLVIFFSYSVFFFPESLLLFLCQYAFIIARHSDCFNHYCSDKIALAKLCLCSLKSLNKNYLGWALKKQRNLVLKIY